MNICVLCGKKTLGKCNDVPLCFNCYGQGAVRINDMRKDIETLLNMVAYSIIGGEINPNKLTEVAERNKFKLKDDLFIDMHGAESKF